MVRGTCYKHSAGLPTIPAAVFLIVALLPSPVGLGAEPPEAGETIRELIELAQETVQTRPKQALRQAEDAAEQAETTGDEKLEVDALNNLAYIHYRLNELEEAKKVLLESLEISRKENYPEGEGIALNRLGNTLWLLEQRLEAKNAFEQALAIHREMGNQREISRTLNNLANAYRYWDDYPRAIELLLEAREGYRKVDYLEGSAWLSFSLGLLYKKLEEYGRAREAFESSLKIYRGLAAESGNNNGIMLCYGQLGDIQNLTGNPEKGLEYHLEALSLRRKSGNKSAIADGLSGVAKSYFFLGDHEQSLDYFFESQKLRDEAGTLDGTASNMRYIGEIYQKKGNATQALKHLTRGLQAARTLNDLDSESEILNMIADIHAEQGRYREAWESLEQHQKTQDLVLNAEIAKKIASLELQQQISNQEAANEELQKENQIQNLQLDRARHRSIFLVILSLFAVSGGIVAAYLHRKQRQIKTLQGLIPICSHCKSIRTDSGYYERLETYLSEHSDAKFSHGICPECYRKYYQKQEDKQAGQAGRK